MEEFNKHSGIGDGNAVHPADQKSNHFSVILIESVFLISMESNESLICSNSSVCLCSSFISSSCCFLDKTEEALLVHAPWISEIRLIKIAMTERNVPRSDLSTRMVWLWLGGESVIESSISETNFANGSGRSIYPLEPKSHEIWIFSMLEKKVERMPSQLFAASAMCCKDSCNCWIGKPIFLIVSDAFSASLEKISFST